MSLLSESFDIDITTKWWLFPDYQGDQFIKFCDIWIRDQNPVQCIKFIVICKGHGELHQLLMQDVKTDNYHQIRDSYKPWMVIPEEEYLKTIDITQMWEYFCQKLQVNYPNAELINI